jgi:outer membrane autotransporter protein
MTLWRSHAGLVGALCGVALSALAATPAAAVQPESAGCIEVNADVFASPQAGVLIAGPYDIANAALTAGETLTFFVTTANPDNVNTISVQNAAGTQTIGSVSVADNTVLSVTVPAGFTGVRLFSAGANTVVTGFQLLCAAAPDVSDVSSGNDVNTDPAQASQLITVQTSTLAVSNISSFINSAVARRLGAGPSVGESGTVAESLGGSGALGAAGPLAGGAMAGGLTAGSPVQVASLLPLGQLVGAATSAISGGGYTQLAVAGAQLADNALAAADRPFGLWVNGAASFLDSDEDGGEYSGDVLSLGGGGDYAINETLLVGLALGYERGDIDTTFNAGDLTSSGFTAAPYVGWQPIPELVLDASIGVTVLDYDISRASDTIEGEFGATRAFVGVNATGNYRFDAIRLSPLAGLLYFREKQDGYTDSAGTAVDGQTIDLGRLTGGAEAGYTLDLDDKLALEPYVRLELELDFIQADEVTLTTGESFRPGRYGATVAGGVNLISATGFAGNLEASYDSLGRDSYDSVTIQGTLRFAF